MYLDAEGIEKMILDFEKDTKAIKEDIYRLSWFMRGGLSFSEAFLLSPEDREIIGKIIESNLEISKNQGISFF